MNTADLNAPPFPPVELGQQGPPIYLQLSTLFRRFIVTGQWPVSQQIPTHESIAARFEVNPATVRKALALLEAEGLVRRFRRRGTFVVGKPEASAGMPIPMRWEEALIAFAGLAVKTLEQRKVKSVPDPVHGCESQARGYVLTRRQYLRGRQVAALEEAYIDQSVRANGKERPLLLLERHKGPLIVRVEQTLRFGIADRDVALGLRIALNAPIAVAHLSAFARGDYLLYESNTYYSGELACVSEAIRFAEPHR